MSDNYEPRFYLPWCGPCDCNGGGDEQCVHTDALESMDTRWEEINLEASHNPDTDIIVATGEGIGSLTKEVTPNPIYISVSATVYDPGGSTSTGVTIRRADSDSNISLVRVWGTVDGFELRKGSTVLEAFTASSGSSPTIKIKIPDLTGATVDVECYVDGVLIHTETGVAFSLPERLNLGLIAEDVGGWTSAGMSPCPLPGCGSDNTCPIPISWKVNVSGVAGDLNQVHRDAEGQIYYCACDRHPFFPDKPILPNCDVINGMYRVLNDKYVSYVTNFSSGGSAWTIAGDELNCSTASSVFGTRKYQANAVPSPYSPEGTYPAKSAYVDRTLQTFSIYPPCGFRFTHTWVNFAGFGAIAPAVTVSYGDDLLGGGKVIAARLYISLGSGNADGCGLATGALVATYESAVEPTDDLINEPIMLSLVHSTELCDSVPGSLTLTPQGEDDTFTRVLLGCESPCFPLATDGIQVVTGHFGGVGVSFCEELTKTFNETTQSWEWMASTIFDTTGNDPDCGVINVDFAIKCLAKEEGQARQWWFIISHAGQDTYLPYEPTAPEIFEGSASGTVNVCESGPFAAFTQTISEEDVEETPCDERSIVERFCDPPCPSVGNPEVVIVNGIINGEDVCSGMGFNCNYDTNAPEWFAVFDAELPNTSLVIRCEDRDGEGRKWWAHVTIDGITDYFPMGLDSPGNFSMNVSGSVNGNTFTFHADEIDETSLSPGAAHIYEACGSPKELLTAYYCIKDLCVSNVWSPIPPDFCPCPDNDTMLSWDTTLERWVGKHPQCGCPGTWQLHVWYSGGQWHWLAGSEVDPVAQGTVAPEDVSCEPFKLEFGWFTTSVNRTYNMTVSICNE